MQSVLCGYDYFILEGNGVEVRLRVTAARTRNLFSQSRLNTFTVTYFPFILGYLVSKLSLILSKIKPIIVSDSEIR